MTTVFDATTRDALIARTEALHGQSTPRWGKMTVYQMITHCLIWNRWVLGVDNPIPYRHDLLGRIFGRRALRNATKDDRPIPRHAPTGKAFLVADTTGDVVQARLRLVDTIRAFADFDNPDYLHDFFGKMTRDQIGIFAFKHTDHHLRQFGV